MDTGLKISGGMHALAIGLALVGGPLFDSQPEEELQVSEVALISGAEFEALKAGAPEPDAVPEPSAISEPNPDGQDTPDPLEQVTEPEPVVPDAQDQPEPPTPEPSPDTPPEPDAPPAPPEPEGQTDVEAPGVTAPQDQAGVIAPEQPPTPRAKPRPADRIANQIIEQTDQNIRAEAKAAEQARQQQEADQKEREQQKEAQQETTTEIVTEADESEKTLAPVATARPKGRPRDLKIVESQPEETPPDTPTDSQNSQATENEILAQILRDQQAAEAARKAEADAAAKARADAARSASASSGQNGTALTSSERDGLIFAVQQCWNVPVAIKNASELKVTLKISLTEDGFMKSSPELVSPKNSPLSGVQHAYEAGRRALIRCQPYKLPPEKYETWKEIEIIFNPQRMVLK